MRFVEGFSLGVIGPQFSRTLSASRYSTVVTHRFDEGILKVWIDTNSHAEQVEWEFRCFESRITIPEGMAHVVSVWVGYRLWHVYRRQL